MNASAIFTIRILAGGSELKKEHRRGVANVTENPKFKERCKSPKVKRMLNAKYHHPTLTTAVHFSCSDSISYLISSITHLFFFPSTSCCSLSCLSRLCHIFIYFFPAITSNSFLLTRPPHHQFFYIYC